MRLRAIPITLAVDATRANRYLRLNDVVPSTGWVSVRIEESQYPVLLMRLRQKQIPRWRSEDRRGDSCKDKSPTQPCEKQNKNARHSHHKRRAHIVLKDNKRRRK